MSLAAASRVESDQTPLLDRPIDFGSYRRHKRHNPAATFDIANHLNRPEVKTEAT
jgi:hypothetical protein